MNKLSAMLVAVLLALITAASLAQNTPEASPFSIRVQDQRVFAEGLGGGTWSFRHWQNGYLVAWKTESSPSRPSVILLDRDNKVVTEAVVWYPNAERVTIADVTVTPTGRLIASGGALDAQGTLAYFISGFDESGKATSTIRTNPFAPNFVCSPDGQSVWAFGWDRSGEATGKYHMLREFTFAGGQRKSMLDAATISQDWSHGLDRAETGMECNASRVSVLLYRAGVLIEHDLNTPDAVVRWELPKLPFSARPTGFALTNSNQFFITTFDYDNRPQTSSLFQLQRATAPQAQWLRITNAIDPTDKSGISLKLLGNDGDVLVYRANSASNLVNFGRPVKEAPSTQTSTPTAK